jgi:hypothetical protein
MRRRTWRAAAWSSRLMASRALPASGWLPFFTSEARALSTAPVASVNPACYAREEKMAASSSPV